MRALWCDGCGRNTRMKHRAVCPDCEKKEPITVKLSAEGVKQAVDAALGELMQGAVARALSVASEALRMQAEWPNVPPDDPRKAAAREALTRMARELD